MAQSRFHQRFSACRVLVLVSSAPNICHTTHRCLNSVQPLECSLTVSGLITTSWRAKVLGKSLWLAEPWSSIHTWDQRVQTWIIRSSPASRVGSLILTSIHLALMKIECLDAGQPKMTNVHYTVFSLVITKSTHPGGICKRLIIFWKGL